MVCRCQFLAAAAKSSRHREVTSGDEGSYEPSFCKAGGIAAGHDDGVQDSYVHEIQRLLQSSGDEFVGLGGSATPLRCGWARITTTAFCLNASSI